MSMGGHQSTGFANDEWITPPEIIKALGPFALDPCAAHPAPWPTAAQHFTKHDGGLTRAWKGFVWLNPPYGNTGEWLARLADHDKGGIALIFARTETRVFFEQVWGKATALLFLEGRLHFHHLDGRRAKANAGAPSVLVAYGKIAAARLLSCELAGKYVLLK